MKAAVAAVFLVSALGLTTFAVVQGLRMNPVPPDLGWRERVRSTSPTPPPPKWYWAAMAGGYLILFAGALLTERFDAESYVFLGLAIYVGVVATRLGFRIRQVRRAHREFTVDEK
jgi:hypothetical protein